MSCWRWDLSLEVHAGVINLWTAKFALKEIVESQAEGVNVLRITIYNLISKFTKLIQR